MIFCNKIKSLLIDYLDNQLDLETKKSIKAHLATCQECKEELNFLRLYKLDMYSLEKINAPLNFVQNVHKKMREKKGLAAHIKEIILYSKMRYALKAGLACIIIFSLYLGIRPFWSLKSKNAPERIITEDSQSPSTKLAYNENNAQNKNDLDILNKKSDLTESKRSISREKSFFPADNSVVNKENSDDFKSSKSIGRYAKTKEEFLLSKEIVKAKPEGSSESIQKDQPATEKKPLLAINKKNLPATDKGKEYKKGILSRAEPQETEKITSNTYNANAWRKSSMNEDKEDKYDYDKDLYDRDISVKSKTKKIANPVKTERSKKQPTARLKSKRFQKRKGKPAYKKQLSTRDTINEIKKIVKKYNGKIIKEKYKNGKNKISYIILEISTIKYNAFIKRLAEIVYINKSPSSGKKKKKKIRLKMRFIN